jgi:ABC-2 type transport system permease protein
MFSIYWSYLKTALALQFQYRVAMSIYMISRLLEPTVYLVIWTTVADARGGNVGGYTPADFAAYYIVLMLVNQFTFTWIMHEYEFRIRSGNLSAVLLKPIHPIHSDLADNIGYKVLTSVIIFPAAGFLYWLFDPAFQSSLTLLGLFTVSMILAYLLRFLLEWSLALIAFWTTRTEAFNQMYFLLGLFLSGRIAPLDLLPQWLRAIADVLPFKWAIAFPVELVLGRLSTGEIASGLMTQAVWLAIGLVLHRVVWWRGVKKYSAVGA